MFYKSLTFLKWLFLWGALGVVAGVFFFSTTEDIREELSRPEGLGNAPHEVYGLNLFIQDQDKGKLTLRASYAFSPDEGAKSFDLLNPQATLISRSLETSEVTADLGHYDAHKNLAVLTGNIRFKNSTGYALNTQKAFIDTKTGRVWGTAPVWGSGPFGKVAAGSFEIRESGKKVKLFKQSKLEVMKEESQITKPLQGQPKDINK